MTNYRIIQKAHVFYIEWQAVPGWFGRLFDAWARLDEKHHTLESAKGSTEKKIAYENAEEAWQNE
jgi:hypothetical protein